MGTLYSGQRPNTPIYLQKETTYTDVFTFTGANYTGDTVKFKAWQYDGAALDINSTCTVGGSGTTVTVSLTATDTNLGYARGEWSIHNETDDVILAWGELIVESVPYN